MNKALSMWRTVVALSFLSLLGACASLAPELPPDPRPQILMVTSLGEIRVELDREKAPLSVDNFVQYVREKHYDGTVFHRVIPGFVAQGGGYTETLKEKPTRKAIAIESSNGLSNLRGTLAMAREDGPDTATSQFYFNLVDNNYRLDPQPDNPSRRFGYAVFGRIISGIEVMDAIARQPTALNPVLGAPDVPVENIVLLKAKLLPRVTSAVP